MSSFAGKRPLKIYEYPSPELLGVARDVKMIEAYEIVAKLRRAIRQVENKGRAALGMAAPQLGIPRRVFVTKEGAYINPLILSRAPKKDWETFYEGCFSLPIDRFDYKVKRSPYVRLSWVDEAGKNHIQRFTGQAAQVLQHEMDHLDGILCNKLELEKGKA
jgi:peptide deformylase